MDIISMIMGLLQEVLGMFTGLLG